MILFRPGDVQKYYLYKKDRPETYWVHFTGFDVESVLEKYNMPRNTATYIGTSSDFPWLFRQMIFELQEKRANYEKMLILQLEQLLLVIQRNLELGAPVRLQTSNEIERAIHYFEEHFSENIVIEQYTKEHFIKPCWFIRNFKNITGRSPVQYIISLRIDKAKRLLESTDYNISQIAMEVGYDNPLYFSRLFSKYTGVSPTEYRKNHTYSN